MQLQREEERVKDEVTLSTFLPGGTRLWLVLRMSTGSFGTKVMRKKHFIFCEPGLCVTYKSEDKYTFRTFGMKRRELSFTVS
ncbi:hypothetical protein EYF80_037917 [Liparis tanakae]|uniref:Uncharacterized protein n=1 Tax=Liparis tanakae TaxID=230148 RepID=A0A4Z2GF79_9TELE|nr:hypothetical protein EYF80_037917 [Liparis tanakae]